MNAPHAVKIFRMRKSKIDLPDQSHPARSQAADEQAGDA